MVYRCACNEKLIFALFVNVSKKPVNILESLKRCSDGGWARQSRHHWASLSLIRLVFVITKLIDLLSIVRY